MSPLALPTLLLVVFVDLVGYGLVAPLVPFYGEQLGLSPQWITAIVASYSLAQFVAAPLWGRLSDRHGRKPILFACMAGHVASYLVLASSHSVATFALARLLGGFTAGNLPVAYAYVADTTSGNARAAALGQISGAFGLGFVLGPAIGGWLAGGHSMVDANLALPALAAAAASGASALMILAFLRESRIAPAAGHATHGASAPTPVPTPAQAASAASATSARSSAAAAPTSARAPRLVPAMLVICFVVIFAMSMRESVFALWASHVLRLDAKSIGLLFALSGAVIAAIQFSSMGALTQRFGSHALAVTATVLFASAWLLFASIEHVGPALLGIAATGAGTALFQASMQNLLADIAGPHERGRIMGSYQSASALARYAGQSLSGTFYGLIHPSAPFLLGAALMAPAAALLWWVRRHLPRPAADEQTLQRRPAG